MSLEITASRVCSSRRPTAQAFVAIDDAVGREHAARRVQHRRRAAVERVTRVPSWMRTPSSSATRRRPRTSIAGCTIAAVGSNMPGDVAVRAAAARRLLGRPLLERHHAELAAGRHDAVPRAELRLRRGRPEVAAAVVVGVDPVRLAERPDLVDGVLDCCATRERPVARRRARRACRAWPTTRARSRRCGRSRRRRRCPARARRRRRTGSRCLMRIAVQRPA